MIHGAGGYDQGMSGNHIGFVVVTFITAPDGTMRTGTEFNEVHGTYAKAERARDRQRAYYEVEMLFDDGSPYPPDRYGYEVAELVTCDPEAGGKP